MNPNDSMQGTPTRRGMNPVVKWLALLIVVLAIGGGGYYYMNMSKAPAGAQDPAKAAAEVKSLTDDVSKLMVLPTGETPLVFDVQDPEQLKKQQPFFSGVVKGDKLLVYPQAVKAILYSPSRKMIVNVGPIQFDQNAKAPAGTTGAPGNTAPAGGAAPTPAN